jgi:hypothetical protein
MVTGDLIREAQTAAALSKAAITVNLFESLCNCESAARLIVKPVEEFTPARIAAWLFKSGGKRSRAGTPRSSGLGKVEGISSTVAARHVAAPLTI